MGVTYRGDESDTDLDPVVTGPRPILYDYRGTPLVRRIGFTLDDGWRSSETDRRSVDNQAGGRVDSRTRPDRRRETGGCYSSLKAPKWRLAGKLRIHDTKFAKKEGSTKRT